MHPIEQLPDYPSKLLSLLRDTHWEATKDSCSVCGCEWRVHRENQADGEKKTLAFDIMDTFFSFMHMQHFTSG